MADEASIKCIVQHSIVHTRLELLLATSTVRTTLYGTITSIDPSSTTTTHTGGKKRDMNRENPPEIIAMVLYLFLFVNNNRSLRR